jgi:hypothetical protein
MAVATTALRCFLASIQLSFSQQQSCDNAALRSETEDVSALLQRGQPSVYSTNMMESPAADSSQLDLAASMMSNIVTGRTTKDEVEVVLAQFDEDISWSDPYKAIRTVYCKGGEWLAPSGCIPLKNVGREGHTYLHHIVQNYDTLSKWTVFTQAGVPTAGYKGHRLGGGHAEPGVAFDAYVFPEGAGGLSRDDGSLFIVTGAVHMSNLNHSLRLSYLHAMHSPALHRQTKCPKMELMDGWQKWWQLGWFKGYIGEKCGVPASAVPELFQKYFDEDIQLPRPPHDILFFSQGARFAVSRDRIRQRPRSFYQSLLQKLSGNVDPCHNYFNEWLWYYIMGKPSAAPCNSQSVIEEANSRKDSDQEVLIEKLLKERREQEVALLTAPSKQDGRKQGRTACGRRRSGKDRRRKRRC